MKIYQVKTSKLPGTEFKEVHKKAFRYYQEERRKSKRKPYIRSAFFDKNKISLDLFWAHTFGKNYWDQIRRMRFFPCGLELIKGSRFEPDSKENPNKRNEIFHRFAGITPEKELFFVQIKAVKISSKKWLISVFPIENKKKALR